MEDLEPLWCCWWKCKIVELLWKMVWQNLKKFNTDLTYNPAISLLSIYPKHFKARTWRYISTASYSRQCYLPYPQVNTTQMSINHWMDKQVLYTYTGILFMKRKEILKTATTWVNPVNNINVLYTFKECT